MIRQESCTAWDGGAFPAARDVVEISVLLPGPLAAALERAARQNGLTAGRLVRHILRDFLERAEEGAKA